RRLRRDIAHRGVTKAEAVGIELVAMVAPIVVAVEIRQQGVMVDRMRVASRVTLVVQEGRGAEVEHQEDDDAVEDDAEPDEDPRNWRRCQLRSALSRSASRVTR